VGSAPAFASVGEAIDMACCRFGLPGRRGMPPNWPPRPQAEVPARAGNAPTRIATAARALVPVPRSTAGKGYSADADYSARTWLMYKTGITRGAAASHTAWARRQRDASPRGGPRSAAGELSESWGRAISQWIDKLPEKYTGRNPRSCWSPRYAAGLGLADLAALFAEMYQRGPGRATR